MKTNLSIALLALAFQTFAQFSTSSSQEEDIRKLTFLNQQYIQSWLRSDTAMFNHQLWADDFVQQSGADGGLYTKHQMLPIFGQPRFNDIEYFFAQDVMVRFLTKDVAMIFALTPRRLKGDTTSGLSRYNNIYVRRNGSWICVSANISNIHDPAKPYQASYQKLPVSPPLISHLQGPITDIQILKALNIKHAKAYAVCDITLLDEVLADDFIMLSTNGNLYDKATTMRLVAREAKNNSVTRHTIENLTICFVADDVAMIHATLVFEFTDSKKSAVQYNDIYTRRNGSWHCAAANNTMVVN